LEIRLASFYQSTLIGLQELLIKFQSAFVIDESQVVVVTKLPANKFSKRGVFLSIQESDLASKFLKQIFTPRGKLFCIEVCACVSF